MDSIAQRLIPNLMVWNACSAISSIAWRLISNSMAREKLLLFVWQKFSIHFRLQSNPMVREKLALPLSSIARWFISNPMDRKILFWHFFPSHGSLYQSRWIGKSFFSKIHPSPKGIFQPRWLYRASGFHRPRNSLNVDGAKGRDQVWKVEDFHHGRNYQRVDGV